MTSKTDADDASTVAAAFAQSADRWPQRAFVALLPQTAEVYGLSPGELGYAQAQRQILALRDAYARAGYGHGHRVGLLLDNRPSFFLHWFALNGLGVSVVPINAELRAAELEYLVGHSEIALAIAPASRHGALRAAAAAAQRSLALMEDPLSCTPPAWLGLATANPSARVPSPAFAAPSAGIEPGDETECALLYTSGTTGRPKGCVLPNQYFLHSGRWYAGIGGLAALRLGLERMLTPLPLVHMNAMAYSTLAMVLTGGCLIVLDRFHPGTWWDSVRASRATVVHYLGVMPAMLMKAPARPDDLQPQLRFGFGAGVDKALHAPFEQRFGFPLLEAWAMTETGAGAVVIANHEPRGVGTSCFGRERDDVQVRLVADHGGEAAVDEPGELWVRHAGPNPRYGFFQAYLHDEAATAEAWDQGWFHTGDIVRRDPVGQLHFIDRRKNVIRRSGENISAVEVESVLNQHPGVKASAVAATPDPVRGDEVLACIVTHETCPSHEQATFAASVVAHALERLAYYKAPGYVAFVDSLPLTASQKIQRGELKALAQTLPGQAHCVDTRGMKKRRPA